MREDQYIEHGETDCPAYSCQRIVDFPPACEEIRTATRIRWSVVHRWLNDGKACSILIGPDDTPELIDALQNRLGFNIVIRMTHPGCVWVCRPDALQPTKTEDPSE